jgi:hypothetical protein
LVVERLTWFFFWPENGKLKGSLTGISIGAVTETQKIWRSFQALGDIAFAYSYSMILIEIQVYLCSKFMSLSFVLFF